MPYQLHNWRRRLIGDCTASSCAAPIASTDSRAFMIVACRFLGIAVWLLAICALFPDESRAQMSTASPTQFFLEQPPTESQLAQIPKSTRNVVIAKVRIDGRFVYLPGEYTPPRSDLFVASVEIIELLRGDMSREAVNVVSANNNRIEVRVVEIYFGATAGGGPPQRLKYPNTLAQMSRDYFIVSRLGSDRKRRLIGFPVSDQEYELWDKEVREERLRDRLGGW
jgi:hypothetical protein